jgi:hypothetical protein
MELLGDVALVESRFCPFGDSVSAGATEVHDLRQTNHKLRKPFWTHPMNSLVTWVMWNLISVHLGTVLILMQDRCAVYAKCTIGT